MTLRSRIGRLEAAGGASQLVVVVGHETDAVAEASARGVHVRATDLLVVVHKPEPSTVSVMVRAPR